MARLEDITIGSIIKGGIFGSRPVTALSIQWSGSNVIDLTYKDEDGKASNVLLMRHNEPDLEIISRERCWNYSAPADLFKLVSEAHRIRMAYLFDPYLAIHSAAVEPLPHQITAVYERMLDMQPLRFLLADDPGAGKTIMAGLLIKELLIRGDLVRCLIVCPGNLAEQWQDELIDKMGIRFEILTNDSIESSATGNVFNEKNLLIARLDKLSRNADIQEKLRQSDWDLIICDEAHKMSASFFGNELKETQRYKLGKLLSGRTRHFLLMTATPHNGKEQDFQLFLSLIDGDRFEGRFRDGVHAIDPSDIMRRMIKEQLLKFDETRLFPPRMSYTVTYALSDLEAHLYERVTNYVREGFNRADKLEDEGRKNTVGFALMILQRRLASSPEAIYQSLKRRRERLESRLREEILLKRGKDAGLSFVEKTPSYSQEEIDDIEEESTETEQEQFEDEVIDQATPSATIEELRIEISVLIGLEKIADEVRKSGRDTKWEQLSRLIQNTPEMTDERGMRRKLIIFTEQKDTLNYLEAKLRTLTGKAEEVIVIHGGIGREKRKKAQDLFTQEASVKILIATDAAGEGINLQRSNLMINYDLPWNPNRLEQRFGRIHRIGQTEVCHLWNLVAEETIEGDVYRKLLEKLEAEREALGGAVFDVLGKAISGRELRDLIIEAIRFGERPDVRSRAFERVENALDQENLKNLIEEHMLAHDTMDTTRVRQIRENMERAAARRLQPHFIESFFRVAFERVSGTFQQREPRRYEITHVPAILRNLDRASGTRNVLLSRYERVTFDKTLCDLAGKPHADFITPGHPLLDTTIEILMEKYRELLRHGSWFVNQNDEGEEITSLYYLEHSIRDNAITQTGDSHCISRRMLFVSITKDGVCTDAGPAPYLDLRPPTAGEKSLLEPVLKSEWFNIDFEARVRLFANETLVPRHFEEVKERRSDALDKIETAVRERLMREINYWDSQSIKYAEEEAAGKGTEKANSANARKKAEELEARLNLRLAQLARERQIFPIPPVIIAGAIVVPKGLCDRLSGLRTDAAEAISKDKKAIEMAAMEAAMTVERNLGYEPVDVSAQKCGYDIESRIPGGGLRFIEVKGREADAKTVTVTKNEVLVSLNKPDSFILALVRVDGRSRTVYHVMRGFKSELDFAVTSQNLDIDKLIAVARDKFEI